MAGYKIISADSHVAEPPELYTELVAPEFRHRTPRVEQRNGGTYRVVEGRKARRLDLAEARLTEEDREKEFRHEEWGGRNLERRVSEIERDGVSAEVIYPDYTLWIFSSPDPDYQMAVAQPYNNWVIDHFRPQGDRFAPVGVVPVIDIPRAIEEIKRLAGLGFKVAAIPALVSRLPYNQPEYEPLWQTIEDSGMALSLHARAVDYDPFPDNIGEEENGGFIKWLVCGMSQVQEPITDLICSGVLERHPGIRFVVAECGAGWLAWLLYALDEQAEKKHMWIRPTLEMQPSEYFKRQGGLTFGDDLPALLNISLTGADVLLWGSDYPHDEGTFPNSQEVIERTFGGLSEGDKRKIVGENAARIYGFSLNGG